MGLGWCLWEQRTQKRSRKFTILWVGAFWSLAYNDLFELETEAATWTSGALHATASSKGVILPAGAIDVNYKQKWVYCFTFFTLITIMPSGLNVLENYSNSIDTGPV